MNHIRTLSLTLLLLFSALGNKALAQGNLQFNQVVEVLFGLPSVVAGSNVKDTTIIIPAGKVWKIESMNISRRVTSAFTVQNHLTTSGALGTPPGLFVDEVLVHWVHISEESSRPQIMWLPAGSHKFSMHVTNGSNWLALFTIIEFNVVP